MSCLDAFEMSVNAREIWYGRKSMDASQMRELLENTTIVERGAKGSLQRRSKRGSDNGN